MTPAYRLALVALVTSCLTVAGTNAWSNEAAQGNIQVAQAGAPAPDFVGINKWLNSEPLSMSSLRGKVVLVDFWTLGCINCVRTLPHVTKLHEKYASQGLVIIGIHTPEFFYEKPVTAVQMAIRLHGIRYPVAQDNDFATWKAYRNQYWPAQYIVNKKGDIVFQHAGEGKYEEIESTIQKLLSEAG